jgi:hypothetical protein
MICRMMIRGSRSFRKFSDHLRPQNLSFGKYEDVGEFPNSVRDVSAINSVSTTLAPLLNLAPYTDGASPEGG